MSANTVPRHAIDVVVDDDGGEVQVAPGSVDEMVSTDGGGVPVSHDDNDMELGLGQLDARGESKRPPVGGVDRIEIHVDGKPARAADARYEGNLVFFQSCPVDGADEGSQENPVAAAWAPDMRKFLVMPEIFVNQFGVFRHHCSSRSRGLSK